MAGKYKRQIIQDTRTQTRLDDLLEVSVDGFFSKIPLEHVGFSVEVLDLLKSHKITMIGQLLKFSPASLRKKKYLTGHVIKMLDALDEYFCNAFEEGRKAYYENPVPLYKLLRLKDIDFCRNYLLYDYRQSEYGYREDFRNFRAHGVITLYDFLKLDLGTYHEYGILWGESLRGMLRSFRSGLDFCIKISQRMTYPLNEHETEVISYPLPEAARYKVSCLTDDRIAGDEVSTARLSSYEKALYDRTQGALEDCGETFYYDVLDNREAFSNLAKSFASFCAPALEFMQRKIMIRNLYMGVPEKFRQMPARALYHYMVPRHSGPRQTSPYDKYRIGRDASFFRKWELFRTTCRMATVEEAYWHLEEITEACRDISDFDRMLENDMIWPFLDLMHWLGRVSMLSAVYDCFLRYSEYDRHEAADEMKAIVPVTDPDEVIGRFAAINNGKAKVKPGIFVYYDSEEDHTWFGFRDRYISYRYDFFAVYMLLSGKTSVPLEKARKVLHPEESNRLINLFCEFADYTYLYEYNPDTDSVDMKPHALEW
ncbi:MAG: hypothetical protein LUE27_02735 [Clostridia bacterium]|nr:hypothetical protein [Clostridia bacterium]